MGKKQFNARRQQRPKISGKKVLIEGNF